MGFSISVLPSGVLYFLSSCIFLIYYMISSSFLLCLHIRQTFFLISQPTHILYIKISLFRKTPDVSLHTYAIIICKKKNVYRNLFHNSTSRTWHFSFFFDFLLLLLPSTHISRILKILFAFETCAKMLQWLYKSFLWLFPFRNGMSSLVTWNASRLRMQLYVR